MPVPTEVVRQYKYLTTHDRKKLFELVNMGIPISQAAMTLAIPSSTAHRHCIKAGVRSLRKAGRSFGI